MRSDHVEQRLLLLAPSVGFGGGIERVADAIERAWHGDCTRVDLYRGGHVPTPAGRPLTKLDFATRVIRESIGNRPDVVLALHVGLLSVGLVVARMARARLALLGIGTEVWAPLSQARQAMVRGCDYLLAISDFTAAMLATRAKASPARFTVLPLPIDEGILAAAIQDGARSGGDPVFVTVSRIVAEHRYKGHWDVADSMPLVLSGRPEATWVVVGSGDDVSALQSHCTALGISDAVRFEGTVSDERLVELYREATALVLPSVANVDTMPPTGEGFGLVYGEAGAFGVPSIASTASGGAAELVRDGDTGITVPPGRPAELARAMSVLMEDPALRERLGNAARERVLLRHTQAAFKKSLLEALSR